jgi:hypothetical protein
MFYVLLPAPPAAMSAEPDEGFARVGMRASDVKALYGTARLRVDYNVNGQPAQRIIYEIRPEGPAVRFTFVDGILTEFADIGRLPADDIFMGR